MRQVWCYVSVAVLTRHFILVTYGIDIEYLFVLCNDRLGGLMLYDVTIICDVMIALFPSCFRNAGRAVCR